MKVPLPPPEISRRRFVKIAALVTAALAASSRRTFGADAVDPDRLPYGGTWNGIVGVRDVDPDGYAQHGATLASSSSAATINAALAAATAAGGSRVVRLGAGTFTINADIMVTDRAALKGQVDANGIPTTILNFTDETKHIYISKSTNSLDYYQGSTGGWTTRNVSSGFSRGSSAVVVSSTPTGLLVGNLLYLSAPGSAATGNIAASEFTRLFNEDGSSVSRPWTQMVKVTAVTGTTVTFTPAINADYLTGTLQVHWRDLDDQINYAGIENLSVKCDNGATMFDNNIVILQGANQCWVRNCFLYGVGGGSFIRNMVHFFACYGCELSHSDLTYGEPEASSSMYAMTTWGCSGLLIVNNHITQTANTCPVLRTDGSVFAYNYIHAMRYNTFLSQWIFDHGSQNHYNLYEGNHLPTAYNDGSTDGNSSAGRNNHYIRNRMAGWETGKNTNLNAITFREDHVNVTMAANVLGTVGVQDGVEGDGGSQGENEGYIYNTFTSVDTTMDRLGNYNTITGGIPAGEALGSNTVATSYVYAEKPDWFGDRPWPPITPSSFSQSDDPENLPAGYRSINGEDPPDDGEEDGSVTSVSGASRPGLARGRR